MAAHGKVGAFNESLEPWASYIERLGHYFVANDVKEDEKKRAILLSSCGVNTYTIIRNLFAPDLPATKSFEEIVAAAGTHFNPKPSSIVQRFRFNSRVRKDGESVAEFVSQLRKLSEHCEFGDTLDKMLRDRIVCGINDVRIQRRLLAEPGLSLAKALELALALETADKDALTLKGANGTGTQPVLSMQAKPRGKDNASTNVTCYRCNGKHMASVCRFKEAQCHSCGKKGHISKACRGKKSTEKASRHHHKSQTFTMSELTDNPESPKDDTDDESYNLFAIGSQSATPIQVEVTINQKPLTMELDTGASYSLISEHTYRSIWPEKDGPVLQESSVKLHTYTGEQVTVVGHIIVYVHCNNQTVELQLLVVKGKGPSLFGRNWLNAIKLNWGKINQVMSQVYQKVIDKYSEVFKNELGTLKGTKAKIHVDPQASPKFFKPRSVPFVLREKVESELDRLHKEDIIEPVTFSEWAAPIVPVVKDDGGIRICCDYKVTINNLSKLESYPIPKVEDLFTALSGGKTFSKLDLSHAYQQLILDEESRKFTTISTHKGLFQYKRLPFGFASAPAIFQRTMDNLLQGIPRTCVYLDDILITGTTQEEHLHNLDQVLNRLQTAGLRLKNTKCSFMLPSVEYLGHVIDSVGLHPTQAKVKAIREAPTPKNVAELRSFLGLINYYGKFLPNLSATLAPLYKLLKQNTHWCWEQPQIAAFQEAKDALQSSTLLVHYDSTKPITLACDASPYGIGAVLSHKFEDGSEKPIGFASRTLSPAEKHYSQLDKEALAIIFGIKKFHDYLHGHHFTIYSDHQPLQYLFGASKPIPPMASGRLKRWALTLEAYEYTIQHKPGKELANADALSRLPLSHYPETVPIPGDINMVMQHLDTTPVTAADIKTWIDKDPLLSKVRQFVLNGWPCDVTAEEVLRPYISKKDELSVHNGCLLWGSRVVIPPLGRHLIVKELHQSHPGISRMKSLSRGYVWWPGMDQALEDQVRSCAACQQSRNKPATAPLHHWEWPERPWVRLHIDYAGPCFGKYFLVLIDSHSKWLEVHPVTTATSAVTIEKLKFIFSTHGLPDMIVSDNGSVFTSNEFTNFMKHNGITHIKSSPYHPSTNGLAERAVQTFKSNMKKLTEGTLEAKLSHFLFHYRLTPQTTTGQSPSELLLGRRIKSRLDLLQPTAKPKVTQSLIRQKANHDRSAKFRVFNVGEEVFVRNPQGTPAWWEGVIEKLTGPLSYKIKLNDGTILNRHVDHIRIRHSAPQQDLTDQDFDSFTFPSQSEVTASSNVSGKSPVVPVLRRSSRIRRPPVRFS